MKIFFQNVYNAWPLTIVYQQKDRIFEVDVSKVLKKLKKEMLVSEHQFELLIAYLDWKGLGFQETLMDKYLELEDYVFTDIIDAEGHKEKQYLEIINMFNIDEVRVFIEGRKLAIPGKLKPIFDETCVGTRVQTYTVDDYIDLIALTIILKAILGPLALFVKVKGSTIASGLEKSEAIRLISKAECFKHSAMRKLKAYFQLIIDRSLQADIDTLPQRNGISYDEIPSWLMANVIFSRLMVLANKDGTDVVSDFYSLVINKIADRCSTKNQQRLKKPTTKDGEDGNVLEQYTMSTELSVGEIAGVRLMCADAKKLLALIEPNAKDHLKIGLSIAVKFTVHIPIREMNIITNTIVRSVIPIKAIDHLDLKHIINILAVSYAFLMYTGHRELALLILTYRYESDGDEIRFQETILDEMSPDVYEKLRLMFPYERESVGRTNGLNLVKKNTVVISIEEYFLPLVKEHTLIYMAPKEVLGATKKVVVPQRKLRDLLANFFIFMGQRQKDKVGQMMSLEDKIQYIMEEKKCIR